MSLGAVFRVALVAALLATGPAPGLGEQGAPAAWRPFTATWTLSGQRHLVPTEGQRPASIVHLSGPLVITSGEGLGAGLFGEVVGFDDGGSVLTGRAVFTDSRGDHIFCTLQAEPIGAGRRATATLTGGTGRFAGLEGSFTFAWQYVVDEKGDEISGRAVDLSGRTRPSASGAAPGAKP